MTDKKEKNSDYYDNVYKQYKHYSLDVDGYHTCYTQLYLFVKNLLQKEEKILELGCGTGQFAEILINEGYNYKFGIDFSEYAIQLSKERCKINLFMKYDLYDLEISKIDFDTIIALEVFEHLENDIKIINSIPSKKRRKKYRLSDFACVWAHFHPLCSFTGGHYA